MPDLKFKVTAKSENKTKTIVKTSGFTMIIDEPQGLGGTDEGPNPVEYLLGALAGCINVVSHIVARELGFELRGLSIDLEGNLNPAKFMGKSDAERTGYKEINVVINPDTDADAATLEKWIHIVESRCPVSDNITNATPVTLTLPK